MIILFDMDGTLVDYPYSTDKSVRLEKNWWLNLSPLQDGMELLKYLKRNCPNAKFVICTKGVDDPNERDSWRQKCEWCDKYIKPITDFTMIVTEDKSLIRGDYLIDDWPPYGNLWLKNNTEGKWFVPLREYNASVKTNSYINFYNFSENSKEWQKDVVDFFEISPGDDVLKLCRDIKSEFPLEDECDYDFECVIKYTTVHPEFIPALLDFASSYLLDIYDDIESRGEQPSNELKQITHQLGKAISKNYSQDFRYNVADIVKEVESWVE